MAENSLIKQEEAVSKYVSPSSNMDSDSCLSEHDRSRHTSDTVCPYYLQGTCFFGPNCKYDHVVVNNENSTESNSLERHSAGPSSRSNNRKANSLTNRCDTIRKNSQQPRFSPSSHNFPNNRISDTNTPGHSSKNWLNAREFVPKRTHQQISSRSYADTVKVNTAMEGTEMPASGELCQLYMFGQCPFEDDCQFLHGDMCDICHQACLHPHDEEQRKLHTGQCEKELEDEIEFSFAIQRSLDKTCSICMDVVLEKEPLSERRFGILEKCNHVFCLSCIRKWRRSKQHEKELHAGNGQHPVVTRTCPVCRTASDFITPSAYFVDSEEEKTELIKEYKKALSKKPCKYFKQGKGTCPFGGACFYLHAKPDGTKVDLPIPTRRRRINRDGEIDYTDEIFLWSFLDYREQNMQINEELTDMFSYSESDEESSDSYLLDEPF